MATQLNDWLSIDKISGTGNAQITLTASSYSELVDRAASLKIQAQSTNAILNVRQNALVPSATLDSYEITAYGEGIYTNGITSNVPWTAVVNGDWITIDKTQGGSGYTPLSITVDATTETRNGSIIFNAEGVILTLQIYQIYDLKKAYFWIEFENTGGEVSGLGNSWTDIYYSFDANTWTAVDSTGVVSLGTNRLVYLKNNTKKLFLKIPNSSLKHTRIGFNSNAKIGGDLSNMTDMIRYCCSELFFKNTYLTDASELILPWTTLIGGDCFFEMFWNCTSLTTAPALPATTLVNSCYEGMFRGCTSLTTAPELPATTLMNDCYAHMFDGCTSLTTAPELPATTLATYCYFHMFDGCTNLNYIKMLATNVSAQNALLSWVNGVSTTGTFVKHPDANLKTGASGIPSGWTVETATS